MLVIAPGREIIDFKVSMRGHLAPIKIKRALHVRQTLDEKVKRRNTLTFLSKNLTKQSSASCYLPISNAKNRLITFNYS